MASAILVAACNGSSSDHTRASVAQCELDDHEDVCTGPTQAITASVAEADAPDVDAGVTYAITAANKHNYVLFTATESGTHTLYYGDSEPVRVCDEEALCASSIDDCGNLKRVAQYAFVEGAPNVIEVEQSDHPFRLHIVGPRSSDPPTTVKLATPVFYGTGSRYATELGIDDLDGDGSPDAVVTNRGVGSTMGLDVMRNSGSGAFALQTRLPMFAPSETVIADFDGGSADIATINSDGQGPVPNTYARGDGDFMYTTSTWTTPVQFKNELRAGDFDEDGVLDLVVTYNHIPGTGTEQHSGFVIYAMPGFSVLQQQDVFGGRTSSVIAGDFNGDGHQDVLVGSHSSAYVALFTGDGSGTVTFARNIAIASSTADRLIAVDLDGNAYTDFIALSGPDTPASATLSSSTGFASQALPDASDAAAAGDFNHDGRIDIIAGDHDIVPAMGAQNHRLLFYRGTNNGFVQSGIVANGRYGQLRAADVNKDGRLDLLTTGYLPGPSGDKGALVVYLGTP